uniref:Uncharacterized protein n=1 Tax=Anguilla anguilla TaxID=7936 RepID=A0A0E9T0V6_ANGAN
MIEQRTSKPITPGHPEDGHPLL